MAYRSPTFWPTIITVPALIVLLGLGTWQIQRMHEKEAMIAERTTRTTAAPISLPHGGDDLSDADYRRARSAGRFLHDKEMYLAARSLNGNPGYQIITPLERDDGAVVLVNRGWIPIARKDPATRAEGQVTGRTTVEGIIRVPRAKNWVERRIVPADEPAKGLWLWTDLAGMAAHAGVEDEVLPVFLEAGPAANPGGYPIGGQTRISLPNDHLQYAITWYALAVALAVIYFIYRRRAHRPEPSPT
jgi:surfeit locus 1 family protein